MKHLIAIVTILCFCLGTRAQNVGQVAPGFMLKTLDNRDYTLSENRGDVIVVFLVGYNCPLCLASAPTVKSDLFDVFNGHSNLQLLIIDTWDGSASAFQTFKNTTNLPGAYLQKGAQVAKDWSTTYDRLVVLDADGKMVFKGNSAASNDVGLAKTAVQSALSVVTATDDLYLEDEFWVKPNYPNPFSEQTTIHFNLSQPGVVSLKIIDLTGKEVVQRTQRTYPAGKNSITLNRNNLTDGIYLYRLEAGQNLAAGKMVVR